MKNKPNKYGIKYWAIRCVFSGYLCDYNVYLGKQNNVNYENKIGEKVVLSGKTSFLVMNLIRGVPSQRKSFCQKAAPRKIFTKVHHTKVARRRRFSKDLGMYFS